MAKRKIFKFNDKSATRIFVDVIDGYKCNEIPMESAAGTELPMISVYTESSVLTLVYQSADLMKEDFVKLDSLF